MLRTNWAGNLIYGAERVVAPATVAEAQEVVRSAAKLRVVGSRHCFNDIADTTGTHLSLERLNGVIALDTTRHQVTVAGGTRYSDIGPHLHERGYALNNLASLPHITIAGACATATHGSGARLGNLATSVAAIEFIDAEGHLVRLSRDRDRDFFPGAVVNLGALGAVTALTLDLEPAFDMRQHVFCGLPLDAVEAHFDEIMASAYSVSLFTRWLGDTIEQTWVKSRVDAMSDAAELLTSLGAIAATEKLHPGTGPVDALACTDQMGLVGPAHDRLPHFRQDAIPATSGDHQAEYFVPVEHAAAAIHALRTHDGRLGSLLVTGEVRVIAADDLWLSPCYGRACVGFHFSFGTNWPALMDVLPGLESLFAPFQPVPHWGKLFTMPPETVASRYPKLAAFGDLVEAYDPHGKFRNDFIDRFIFGQS